MYVKVCGLINTDQIEKAIELGYDAVGVVTYPKSKRYCPSEVARKLAVYAKGRIDTFVVAKSYAEVEKAADVFDYVQIYEPKALSNLVFASKDKPPETLKYVYFMYDGSAGSGIFKAFPKWLKEMDDKLIVAGGLNQDNVCEVIRKIQPFGVDISSGVEKNGIKDFQLMRDFIKTVRDCS
jgi:phosphoribosylanthranilate isomerase